MVEMIIKQLGKDYLTVDGFIHGIQGYGIGNSEVVWLLNQYKIGNIYGKLVVMLCEDEGNLR